MDSISVSGEFLGRFKARSCLFLCSFVSLSIRQPISIKSFHKCEAYFEDMQNWSSGWEAKQVLSCIFLQVLGSISALALISV